jgi:hypothetical protein
MTKPKIWCSHPERHNGSSKLGRTPSHPKGKNLLPPEMINFWKGHYWNATMNTHGWYKDVYLCTTCYEYELAKFRNVDQLPSNHQLSDNNFQAYQSRALRSKTRTVSRSAHRRSVDEHTSESEQSEMSSDDEAASSYERNSAKETLNNLFCLLKIEPAVDM